MKPKILVVDDDRIVGVVTAELLRREGYDVVIALSVEEAVGCVGRDKFQLVITDYGLGDGSGEDVVLAVWRMQPATPVFIITGDCIQLPSWLSDGRAVARVFAKPYSPTLFLTAVKNVLTLSPSKEITYQPISTVSDSNILPKGVEAMVHRVIDQESIIAITDKKGTIVYANDRFSEVSGYARSELIGQNHRLLKSGEHTHAFFKALWGTILSGRTWRGEICNRAKDGHRYYVDTTITPLCEKGLITHFLSIRSDITTRKEAELALIEQGKREEEDRRMAALGRMADGVVHDLNNILVGAMGIASAIEAGPLQELLHDSISLMVQLTRTLRDFSTGRPTKPEPFKLNPLLSCACSLVRHRKEIPHALTIVELIGPTDGVELIGNEGQIFEVVLNLVVNAIEAASTSAQPRILVRTEMEESRVVICVQDNGPGVSESVAHSIFEPFTSTKGEGRGVGLSSSRSIVVAHGGELRLEDVGGRDRGACFQIILPAHNASDLHFENEAITPATGTRRVVLVSEDEIALQRLIARNASEVGLTVINAGDLADLLALAAKMKEVLAVAILDSSEVNSENGAVACLRRLLPELPIILISGSLKSRGKSATPWGEVESFPKPFESEALVRVLNGVLVRN